LPAASILGRVKMFLIVCFHFVSPHSNAFLAQRRRAKGQEEEAMIFMLNEALKKVLFSLYIFPPRSHNAYLCSMLLHNHNNNREGMERRKKNGERGASTTEADDANF
jgi:hypothetical protein